MVTGLRPTNVEKSLHGKCNIYIRQLSLTNTYIYRVHQTNLRALSLLCIAYKWYFNIESCLYSLSFTSMSENAHAHEIHEQRSRRTHAHGCRAIVGGVPTNVTPITYRVYRATLVRTFSTIPSFHPCMHAGTHAPHTRAVHTRKHTTHTRDHGRSQA